MAGMAGIEPAMRESKSRALTAWLHPTMEESAGPEPPLRPCRLVSGVGDGTRTHDTRNHNPMLYQLNYIHHMEDLRKTTHRLSKRDRGCFWYARRDSNPRPTA